MRNNNTKQFILKRNKNYKIIDKQTVINGENVMFFKFTIYQH